MDIRLRPIVRMAPCCSQARCAVGHAGRRCGDPQGCGEVQPAVSLKAQEFPLSAVRLLTAPFGRPWRSTRPFCSAWTLIACSPAFAGRRASQEGRTLRGLGGIPDKGRFTLNGQGLGHYLSALSMMASATGDAECKRRVDAIVDELAACQKAVGTGMLCAFPESRQLFTELATGQIKSDHLFGLNGGYVPLYVTTRSWPVCGTPGCSRAIARHGTSWSAWQTGWAP